ncbi:MAG: HIT domain-containing protein [Bacteriodetes bacterium]|nr:HIT domain-containing protein [Bacteroidota bacterium]
MRYENIYSHLTAKERTSLSFPARVIHENGLLLGDILDYGCGLGTDVSLLANVGYNIKGYDPYYFPSKIENKFDTILCFYVLNVLMPEEQSNVLLEVSRLLKPNGKAYFAVRRDITYEGFRLHKVHRKHTYQCRVRLPYKPILKNDSCEIYEYQHYNTLSHKENSDCPFCTPNALQQLILESATVFSLYDKFPVSKGHALIIPKKHIPNYFDLNFKEQSACFYMVNKVQQILLAEYKPDGFNIGINVGSTGGQTVPHAHIHLMPRYNGDVENPRGGVRGVIPGKQSY